MGLGSRASGLGLLTYACDNPYTVLGLGFCGHLGG